MCKTNQIFFIIVFFVSFLLRCVIFISGTEDLSAITYPDEKNYYLSAAEIIQKHGVFHFFDSERSLWNGPINPLWIALFGSNIIIVKFLNLLCLSWSTALFSFGIARLWGLKIGSIVGTIVISYYPTYVFGSTLLTEPLYLSFLMASLGLLLCNIRCERYWIVSGLLLGVATLVRPSTQLAPWVYISIGSIIWWRQGDRKLLLLGMSSLLIITPVVLHNYFRFNKLGIANGSGAVLYLGNDLRRNGDEPLYSGVDFDTYKYTAPYTHLDTEGDKRLAAIAKQNIKDHPKEIFYLTLEKVVHYVFGTGLGYFYPAQNIVDYRHYVSLFKYCLHLWWALLQIAVSLFGLVGIVVMLCSADVSIKTLGLSVGILTAYLIALHSITFPIPRLALPLFPFLLVGVASMLAFIKYKIKNIIFILLSYTLVSAFIIMRPAPHFFTEAEVNKISYYKNKQSSILTFVNDVRFDGGVTTAISKVGTNDPFYVFTFSPVSLSRTQVIYLNYKVICSKKKKDDQDEGTGQLFWATKEQPTTEEARSIQFPLRVQNGTHILKPALNPLWIGELSKLRFDFPVNFGGCEVQELTLSILE
jgi:hypothetical protein